MSRSAIRIEISCDCHCCEEETVIHFERNEQVTDQGIKVKLEARGWAVVLDKDYCSRCKE
jgi:hypothetical protein